MSSALPKRLRDDSPTLRDSLIREASIAAKRFAKASKLADLLMAQGLVAHDLTHMTDESWSLACRVARVNDAGLVTRVLVECIMRDRASGQ